MVRDVYLAYPNYFGISVNDSFLSIVNSTLSDYKHARHTRRERVSSAMDGKLKSIHGAWISAIHAGMTILDSVIMKSDKVELI